MNISFLRFFSFSNDMRIKKSLSVAFLLALLLALSGCTNAVPAKPTIKLSGDRIPANGDVHLSGEGFTPRSDAYSHLKRPDGTEFPTITMLTDDKGQFTHLIETWLLQVGVHEVWVIDQKTGVSSNVATFEVTTDQPPAAKEKL
jgi:hypothetical protein